MKQVFSNSEVCHVWARNEQISGRNSNGSIFFDQVSVGGGEYTSCIYSYGRHFPMAAFDKDDKNVVFVTYRAYSNTTAKHMNDLKGAISHMHAIKCYNPASAASGFHSENLERFKTEIDAQIQKLGTARKPDIYAGFAACWYADVVRYCDAVGIEIPAEFQNVRDLINDPKFYELAKERERKQREKAKVDFEKWLKAWKKCDDETAYKHKSNVVGKILQENKVYLRVLGGGIIETSKGIRLDQTEAKRIYIWYMRTVSNGGCIGNCREKAAGYDVRTATDKVLIAGCHTIHRGEINYIANLLKW